MKVCPTCSAISVPQTLCTLCQCSTHFVHAVSVFHTLCARCISVPHTLCTLYQCSTDFVHAVSVFHRLCVRCISVPQTLCTLYQCSTDFMHAVSVFHTLCVRCISVPHTLCTLYQCSTHFVYVVSVFHSHNGSVFNRFSCDAQVPHSFPAECQHCTVFVQCIIGVHSVCAVYHWCPHCGQRLSSGLSSFALCQNFTSSLPCVRISQRPCPDSEFHNVLALCQNFTTYLSCVRISQCTCPVSEFHNVLAVYQNPTAIALAVQSPQPFCNVLQLHRPQRCCAVYQLSTHFLSVSVFR